jgi:asparagine synthase (glutamine-hydrolysing)
MCGFCGIYLRSDERPDESLIVRMRDLMADRGPDAAGVYTGPAIGLGVRRLRILDLTPAGDQPMTNEDGSIWTAFNGEIYNFEALRTELRLRGHTFRSTGDTEVLVHGYKQWGTELPAHLIGMFAFAIWDAARRQLFLARDKLGKKPLFYFEQPHQVLFASNLKSVCAALPVTPPLDHQAIDEFLTFGAIPSPRTIYRGMRQLRPGEQAVFHDQGSEVARYWRLSFRDPLAVDEREAEDRLHSVLRTAVARRLEPEVPVGVLLSGGVDSSMVAALMAEMTEEPVAAFTMGACADEPEGAPLAWQAAFTVGARHTVRPMPIDSGLSDWAELVWQFGQPFGDPSVLPTYAAARLARQHVSVVLTGDGGDEEFAGYPRYTWLNRLERWQRACPSPLRVALAKGGERRLSHRPHDRWGMSLVSQNLPLGGRLTRSTGWLHERPLLYTPGMADELNGTHPDDNLRAWVAEADGETDLARALYADHQSWLPDIMLAKVDGATMAVGLEARCPLLDEDVVQLAARLPDRLKIGAGRPAKYLLRRLASRYVPPAVAWQGKVGFRARQAAVLRGHPEFVRRLLCARQIAARGLLRPDTVAPIVEEFLQHGCHGRRIWLLLWLELWMRMFLDGSLHREMTWEELLACV